MSATVKPREKREEELLDSAFVSKEVQEIIKKASAEIEKALKELDDTRRSLLELVKTLQQAT